MRTTIFLGLCLLFLSSCSDEVADVINDATRNPGILKLQLNGVAWDADANTIESTFESDPSAGDHLDIRGRASDGSEIYVSTTGLNLRTYKMDVDNNIFDGLVTYIYILDNKSETPFVEKAEVTITSHDPTTKTVAGTFKFNSTNDEFVGVGGSFSNIVYKEI